MARSSGAQDIYIMDIVSKQWVQLTHDGVAMTSLPGRRTAAHRVPIHAFGQRAALTMLADGSNAHQLTTSGGNTQPNWSWK